MRFIVTRKRMIMEFATKIARLQKQADENYYRDKKLKNYESNHSSWLLDQVVPLKQMCQKLGISDQVYKEAYKIYDFRNSGKDGYTLVGGKIVKQV